MCARIVIKFSRGGQGGPVVRPCLLPVVCWLWRLMSPWSPSELAEQQQGGLRVEVAPGRVGHASWMESLPGAGLGTRRPAARKNERGPALAGLNYHCCFSATLLHHLPRWIVLISRRGEELTPALPHALQHSHNS